MKYIKRTIEDKLIGKLHKGKALSIYGPRQAGKTTLARRHLRQFESRDVEEYQVDDPSQAALFMPEVATLSRIVGNKKVLFIDEAQSIENAGLVLKLLVDNFPEVQVIATGSSSFELSDKVKESMVGRAYTATLLPLSAEEISGDEKGKMLFDIERAMRFGSYPEVAISDDNQAREILTTITESYLYKDILAIAGVQNPATLRKLLTALALQVGQEVSYNELAAMLEVSRTMVERYIYLLEQCFVVYRLDPLSSNPRKILASRKRKIYFYDIGIRNVLAGQLDIPVNINPQIGGLFENFCITERLKTKLNHGINANSYYWRSPDSEVDYIEQSGSRVSAYEIKWNKRVKSPPRRFAEQFPDADFMSVNRDNFWQMVDAIDNLA